MGTTLISQGQSDRNVKQATPLPLALMLRTSGALTLLPYIPSWRKYWQRHLHHCPALQLLNNIRLTEFRVRNLTSNTSFVADWNVYRCLAWRLTNLIRGHKVWLGKNNADFDLNLSASKQRPTNLINSLEYITSKIWTYRQTQNALHET
jgi:hypothetical protein